MSIDLKKWIDIYVFLVFFFPLISCSVKLFYALMFATLSPTLFPSDFKWLFWSVCYDSIELLFFS